jgi:hypothetical protein
MTVAAETGPPTELLARAKETAHIDALVNHQLLHPILDSLGAHGHQRSPRCTDRATVTAERDPLDLRA